MSCSFRTCRVLETNELYGHTLADAGGTQVAANGKDGWGSWVTGRVVAAGMGGKAGMYCAYICTGTRIACSRMRQFAEMIYRRVMMRSNAAAAGTPSEYCPLEEYRLYHVYSIATAGMPTRNCTSAR